MVVLKLILKFLVFNLSMRLYFQVSICLFKYRVINFCPRFFLESINSFTKGWGKDSEKTPSEE